MQSYVEICAKQKVKSNFFLKFFKIHIRQWENTKKRGV